MEWEALASAVGVISVRKTFTQKMLYKLLPTNQRTRFNFFYEVSIMRSDTDEINKYI